MKVESSRNFFPSLSHDVRVRKSQAQDRVNENIFCVVYIFFEILWCVCSLHEKPDDNLKCK
jgi:hypothetical protein